MPTREDPTEREVKHSTDKEIKDTLKGILGWVEKKKVEAKSASKTTVAKPWGWVVGLIVSVVVLIGLALIAFWAWRKGREIAKLKHQLDVDKEKKEQAKVDLKLAKSESERKELENKEKEIDNRIKLRTQEIIELEAKRRKAHAKIDAITTWEDVDKLLEDQDG